MPVKVVGSSVPTEELAIGRSIVGSKGIAQPWASDVTDARGLAATSLSTSAVQDDKQ